MKKFLNYFRSMQFGLILLGLIAAISVAGSLISQGETTMYYVRMYSWYQILLFLQLDHVFTSWYFIVLIVLLCINLTLCSITRWKKIDVEKDHEIVALGKANVYTNEEEKQIVVETLKKHHCKEIVKDNVVIYEKNAIGRYGTFITHLGILFTVIFFAVAMYTPVVIDQTCLPGEAIELSDGTLIKVESFRIEDEEGNLDYTSEVEIILSDGRTTGVQEVSVNYPVGIGSYKVYQQTYGTIGSVIVTDDNGEQDLIYLEPNIFLSKDGHTGIYFNALYPDFVQDGDDFSLITSVTGSYPNPVYTFNLVEYNDDETDTNDLKMTPMLAFPLDEIDAGGLHFQFQRPTEYPGLRIKKSNPIINVMLMLSFLLMTIGFAVAFLMQPVLVGVYEDGYHIYGSKPEGVQMMLRMAFNRKKEE